jgi:type I restriction enzyme R subunit
MQELSCLGKTSADLHPAIPEGKVESHGGWVVSKPIEVGGQVTPYAIRGKYDLLMEFPDGTYGVVDCKFQARDSDKSGFYSPQLEAYAFGLENPAKGEPKQISSLGLLVWSPVKIRGNSSGNFGMELKCSWYPMERNPEALKDYTASSRSKVPVEIIDEALGVFFEKLTIIHDMLHGCSIDGFMEKPHSVIPVVANFILGIHEGKKRFADASAGLSKAHALVNSHSSAIKYREEVALYQAIRVMLTKSETTTKTMKDAERDLLMRQALSKGIVPEGIIDVFSAAGLTRPDIGLLSEEFLREIRAMKEKNLAFEALSRLLKGEIKARFRTNVVQHSLYSDLLEGALARYRNRSIETAQLIEELINMAKKLNEQIKAGNPDGLTDYEVAFYDALEINQAAVREMEHATLVQLAQELTKKVKENIKVDWSVRESTQAALRIMVRDLLDKYGYPPDFSRLAVETVMRQAESLTEEWLLEAL